MSTSYTLQFGSGDPRTFTGLAPTFLIFVRLTDGQTIAPPSISEALASSGIYKFTYGTTQPIAFLADAATTSPGTAGRYVTGQIDPADLIDTAGTTLIALGTTMVALGTTGVALGVTSVALGVTGVALGVTSVALGVTAISLLNGIGSSFSIISLAIGTTASSYGTTVQPVDLFGYLRRIGQLFEGDEVFYKSSGVLDFFAQGTSTLLREKTISNSISTVIKI